MMMNGYWRAAIVAMSVSAAPGAQSGKGWTSPEGRQDDQDLYRLRRAVNHGATFLLTHVRRADIDARRT